MKDYESKPKEKCSNKAEIQEGRRFWVRRRCLGGEKTVSVKRAREMRSNFHAEAIQGKRISMDRGSIEILSSTNS